MKWIAVSGSWRHTNRKIEEDVRKQVCKIFNRGDGIVSGGALGVDYFATDEALKLGPNAERIRIFLPTDLETYKTHYLKRAKEGVITTEEARKLIGQLEKIASQSRSSIVENPRCKKVNKKTYFKRINKEIDFSDELIAFHVNRTEGVRYTINKAKEKGIPVRVFRYRIN